MNIKQLKTLLTVVESKSFAAAGDALGLSHSAISLQIKAMEEELGVPLFDRIKRPPVPTARARALADHARKTLALFEASAAVARGELVRTNLAIGAVPTALASFVPAGLKRLQTQFPKLGMAVTSGGSGALADRLCEGELDIVICTRPINPIPGLEWHPIAAEPLVVVAPAEAVEGDYRSLLKNHPFIWFNRKTWAGRSIEEALADQDITVRAKMEIDSLEAISTLVGEGLGVSIVPLCKGKPPFPAHVRTVAFGKPQFCREIGALTGIDGQADLVISAFLEALRKE